MNIRLLVQVIILGAVIISALGVVYTRHQSRQLAGRLDEIENQRDAIVAEWSRLQLEQAWLADAGQVETKAENHLGMHIPEQTKILVLRP